MFAPLLPSIITCSTDACYCIPSTVSPSVENLIAPEIRSVVRHASRLERNGCSGTSDSFAKYAFNLTETELRELNPSITLDEFNPCKHIALIQEKLGFVPDSNAWTRDSRLL